MAVSEGNIGMDSAVVMSSQPEPELELTILMPCLNEAETLETCIRKAQDFVERNHVRGEIVD